MMIDKVQKIFAVCAISALAFTATAAVAMEDLRSAGHTAVIENTQTGEDTLSELFGDANSISVESDLADLSGQKNVLQLTHNDLDAFNAGNQANDSVTGAAMISDSAFQGSTLGQAAVVSGNNNNVQMSTTVNVNLY
jgi:hypothetical protein